jgi:enolase
VLKAVSSVSDVIRKELVGEPVLHQYDLDKHMVEKLDGTRNEFGWTKGKLGANAVLAVSLALARAGAAEL